MCVLNRVESKGNGMEIIELTKHGVHFLIKGKGEMIELTKNNGVHMCSTPKEIQHGIRDVAISKKEGWNFDLMVALPFYMSQGQPRKLRFVRFSGGVCFVRAAPSLPITHYSSIAYGVSKNKGTPKSI